MNEADCKVEEVLGIGNFSFLRHVRLRDIERPLFITIHIDPVKNKN